MTATLAASAAVIKLRYPKGKLPKSLYKRAKLKATASMEAREDWTGGNWELALQNENPQGSGTTISAAQAGAAQGTYAKFSIPRRSHFGVARIQGEALKAVAGDEGALVDLWKNETEGIAMTEMLNNEIAFFLNGSGAKGQIASGQATATVTLAVPTDVLRFCLNETVVAVSDSTLSPTVRTGTAVITGIDRVNGTLTVASTWATAIPAIAANDFLVRSSEQAIAGVAAVMWGFPAWIPGGTSPGTFNGLNRNTDPVRYAGQRFDCTGLQWTEALIEMSARVNAQGGDQPTAGFAHPRQVANMKKFLDAKRQYDKSVVESKIAGVSFKGIEVEGDEDSISIMTTPFIGLNGFHLANIDSWCRRSLDAAPHLQNYDKSDFLRVANDDAYEVRFAAFQNTGCSAPYSNIDGFNWGA